MGSGVVSHGDRPSARAVPLAAGRTRVLFASEAERTAHAVRLEKIAKKSGGLPLWHEAPADAGLDAMSA